MVDPLTLTVNSRLARWLLFRNSRRQARAGREVWEAPAIYSLADWLRRAWLQSWPNQHILTELQSKHLWQQIIREDRVTSAMNLLHVRGAAQHAFNAYQLIRQYRLPDNPSEFNHYTEETQTFRRWMESYQQQLKKWKALDPSELLDHVRNRMEQGHIPLPREVRFYGFDEITPQHNDWLDFIKSRSVDIHFLPYTPAPVSFENLQKRLSQKQASVHKYEDRNEEVIHCARWIRSVYQEGQTVGIVVPELESYRSLLEREFKAELAPASVYPWEDKHLPFNISLGTPLSHQPMIHLALLLLSQKGKRIPLMTFSTLITSPFLKNPSEEIPLRRNLDWNLRASHITHLLLSKALNAKQKKALPALDALLKQLSGWVEDTTFRRPSEWAHKISELLNRMEWPHSRKTLTSLQYQVLNSWNECLDAFASLDRVLPTLNRHRAVAHLSHIAGETLFQPQTHEEPIQIVGLLESAGMEFDHLWIMGCHAETLPAYPDPNPFLPFLSLQKPFRLPHSTAERELEFAEQTLYRLTHACERLIFSYPAWQGETELMPSPLLTSWLAKTPVLNQTTSSKLVDQPGFVVSPESIEEYLPIPVFPEEKDFIQGGTQILKNQSECPFRAFAVHRLSSDQKSFPELDVDASTVGKVIHRILELFWKRVQTSEQLHALHESGTLQEHLAQCVRDGMQEFSWSAHKQDVFLGLERDRLVELMAAWMEYERERPHFEVQITENEKTILLHELPLTLKVDRIDRTRDGKTILIDYKTGQVPHLKKWFGERIEEPQLPLYFMGIDADALAFATIRKGELRYRGLSREENLIPRVSAHISKENPNLNDWGSLKEYWRTGLHLLAREFLEGHCRVKPLNKIDTCKYCDQITLCRKTELFSGNNGETE